MNLCNTLQLSKLFTVAAKQPSTTVAWLETIVITLALPGIGLWFKPTDPFFLHAGFLWLILPPLLLGLRYGFTHGFSSALGLILTLTYAWYLHLVPVTSFPTEIVIGLLLVGTLSGEFRDGWNRQQHRLNAVCHYQQMRLEEFTRVYHLLKVSHARLEQKLAGSTVSLRNSLIHLQQQMLALRPKVGEPIAGVGNQILQIFSQHGWLQTAAIYPVEQGTRIILPAAAQLGKPTPISSANPLVLEALRTGHTVSIHADHRIAHEGVLAVVPLIDITGRIRGLVTVHEMPFIAFQPNNLYLLTIMGGYIADLLMSWAESSGEQGVAAHAFKRQLQRSLVDALHTQVPAALIAIVINSPFQMRDPLIQLICTQRRSLDQIWIRQNRSGQPVLLVLLPVTNATGVEDYIQRLKQLAKGQFGLALPETGMIFDYQLLNSKKTAEEILTQFELKFEIVTQAKAADANAPLAPVLHSLLPAHSVRK